MGVDGVNASVDNPQNLFHIFSKKSSIFIKKIKNFFIFFIILYKYAKKYAKIAYFLIILLNFLYRFYFFYIIFVKMYVN